MLPIGGVASMSKTDRESQDDAAAGVGGRVALRVGGKSHPLYGPPDMPLALPRRGGKANAQPERGPVHGYRSWTRKPYAAPVAKVTAEVR